ncbi:putative deoxyribonuclease TATDN1 isoform X1 [Varroa jacobsoni]|uniref:putative deoxyribonuclease TATDN1 isoform X1 n=1 Tax=Varroa jacobsoni TaxID=62625 RepID=UPI000BF80EA6|nr:putative deoxyribonuclease TATDN1 isoform X1 [Varroa jacobsoni]XP_022695789.1 putative deoxyribonuclease TATDN1 isoform X1 [Varroa jacobsoni]XP_022695790.1 putative deoxyribonuclease TATDN1 isoform X1 [Varroa jacobsoni]XP_022695791.1 putative deoxyribonuclease TATDN1 isoform X1 [Varroa jacobsoni]
MLRRRFIDIGANITDEVFRGVYHGSTKHPDDFEAMIKRAKQVGLLLVVFWIFESFYSTVGVQKLIITGGSLESSRQALELASTGSDLYCTVGCHPTRCSEFDNYSQGPEKYLEELIKLARSSEKVVAVGEFGLDYDRSQFCSPDVQRQYFEFQFELAVAIRKPLFLHCRSSGEDFLRILQANRKRFSTGVVHSFDGTWDQARAYIDMDLYIGINGCSLKTIENLEVVKKIPSDRLMIETDCPYCDIKPTHAGHKFVKTTFESKKKERFEEGKQVKGRNEPQNIVQVLEVIAGCRGEDADQLADALYANTEKIFFK